MATGLARSPPTSDGEEVSDERAGVTERFETVVIGGGQAGLAVGHHWPGAAGAS